MPKRPVGVTIYRPFDHEIPLDLLDEGYQEAQTLNLDFVRIAKREEQILGVYRLQRIDAISFELAHLLVVPSDRRLGIGWWLACHALGLAEAKGGRSVAVSFDNATSADAVSFFSQLGFEHTGDNLQLTLSPE